MKLKVKQDNYGRVRKVRELSLNEKKKNTIKAISTWAFAAVGYPAGIVDWIADDHEWCIAPVGRRGQTVCDSERERKRGREGGRERGEREEEAGCQWSGESGGTLVAALFEESRGQFR